jgi:hypothetical protein
MVELYYTNKMSAKGDFSMLNFHKDTIPLLADAYQAVTVTEEWANMAKDPGTTGFAWCREPYLKRIQDAMKLAGEHTGATMAWTLRIMQQIARKGWDTFCEENRVA